MRLTKEEKAQHKPGLVELQVGAELEGMLERPIVAWTRRELGLFAFEVGWPELTLRDQVEVLAYFVEFNDLDTPHDFNREETRTQRLRGEMLMDLLTEENAHAPATVLEKLMELHPTYAETFDHEDFRLALREAAGVWHQLLLELGYGVEKAIGDA